MKLITRFELAPRSKNELQVLYREVFGALALSATGSAGRRNAHASQLDDLRKHFGLAPDDTVALPSASRMRG